MIIGIGTDLTSIKRVHAVYQKQPARFLKRLLHPKEKTVFDSLAPLKKKTYLAKRWAGKEAFAKALGTAIRDDVCLNDIAILNNAKGQPFISLSGGALRALNAVLAKNKTANIHISLTDEGDSAFAIVIIEQMKKTDGSKNGRPSK
jgi:holo-[acyl-carrier protein] synthase